MTNDQPEHFYQTKEKKNCSMPNGQRLAREKPADEITEKERTTAMLPAVAVIFHNCHGGAASLATSWWRLILLSGFILPPTISPLQYTSACGPYNVFSLTRSRPHEDVCTAVCK